MKKKFTSITIMAGICLLMAGCGKKEEKKEEKQEIKQETKAEANELQTHQFAGSVVHYDQAKVDPKPKQVGRRAFAVIHAKEGSEVVGAVTFTEEEGGVRVLADIGGLTPGKHGFHIHEHGDCSAADASSAGGHFNPTGKKHGGPDSAERHAGDLGNLEANEYGLARYDRLDTGLSITGENSIIGKSIMIHANEDDLTTDPTGNSGKRIGCGEILGSEL